MDTLKTNAVAAKDVIVQKPLAAAMLIGGGFLIGYLLKSNN